MGMYVRLVQTLNNGAIFIILAGLTTLEISGVTLPIITSCCSGHACSSIVFHGLLEVQVGTPSYQLGLDLIKV